VSVRARLTAAVGFVRDVVRVVRAENVSFLAASVAYYAFVSLIPALALALVLATVLGGEALAARVLEASSTFLTEQGQALVAGALDGDAGRGGVTLVGGAVLLWGSLKVFRGLDTAFSVVYGVEGTESLVGQIVDSLLVSLGVGVGLVLMLVVGAVVFATDFAPVAELAGIAFLPAALTLAFLPMYYRFPDVGVSVREALPGALVAGVGWTLLQAGFQLYVARAGAYAVYGAIGAVLLLVTWLYVAALLLVVGAVVNVTLTAREPGPGAASLGPVPVGGADRQLQQPPGRRVRTEMDDDSADRPGGAPDLTALDERVEELRADLDAFEADVDARTVDRPELKAELERYVRERTRRGHARGWGPYLVLLYGVVLTLGAFRYLQNDLIAVGAMVVIFLSTLGLYALFVVVGATLGAARLPGRLLERLRDR
jgi:YihY family inner membrane protein